MFLISTFTGPQECQDYFKKNASDFLSIFSNDEFGFNTTYIPKKKTTIKAINRT